MRPALQTSYSAHHPQLGIIQQRLGHCAQVVGSPDQLLIAFHHAGEGHVSYIAHQFRSLFASALARNAGGDAEQRLSVAFGLKEEGFAHVVLVSSVVIVLSRESSLLAGRASSRVNPLLQAS